jgi:GT2 family glycosyltransferase
MIVTIIIPTLLKNREYLLKCLEHLDSQSFDHQDFEVIVVVNSQEKYAFQTENYRLTVLNLEKNYGFAGATNIGIDASTGQYIVTLNDDCFVTSDWLKKLVQTAEKTRADMVASRIYHPVVDVPNITLIDDSQWELDSLGFLYAMKGKADVNLDESITPFGPDAAAALYSSSLITKVGTFDEKFFAYLEDVDLAFRAQRAGMKCALSEARAFHIKHATSSTMSTFKKRQDFINWWRLILKNYTASDWLAYAPSILLERGRNLSGYLKSLLHID